MHVYLVNESTKLSYPDAWKIVWALDYQAYFHFGRSGWRSDVRCSYLPGGGQAVIPAGGAVLHMLDTSDQPGALGYHDEDGNGVPFARVFVATALSGGDQPSEVASHELLELAADPNVCFTALTADSSRLYAVEVGDPVQGNAYDVGAPEGRTTGIMVADFALPGYFDSRTPADRSTSFRGAIKGPFTLAPKGYMSYMDLRTPGSGWTQQFGSERTSAPPPDRDDHGTRRVTV